MKNILLIILFTLLVCQNKTARNKELCVKVRSGRVDHIMHDVEEIARNRDTAMIGALLYDAGNQ